MREEKQYSAPMLVPGSNGQLKVAKVRAPVRAK